MIFNKDVILNYTRIIKMCLIFSPANHVKYVSFCLFFTMKQYALIRNNATLIPGIKYKRDNMFLFQQPLLLGSAVLKHIGF